MTDPLTPAVKAEAIRLGFVACGITTLDPLPHADALDRWLKAGYGGNMRYIHRQAKKRKHPQLADRNATRAVVVLDNYYYHDSGDIVNPGAPRIARYARGEDYHRVTLARLEALAAFLRTRGATVARPYADTGPIAERELAQRAGLGWIGKNTMLIGPESGSWFFIGSVLTDLELETDQSFDTDRCGTCTRCLDACPTGAFVAERVLDATRCISYVTIEQKGEIPEAVAPQLEGWAFGCDICNEVCPWNQRFAEESRVAEFAPRETLRGAGPDYFEKLTEEEFLRRFGDTPLSRPGLERMRRNWRAASRRGKI
jgi:epoxyqueuosine reductase